MADYLPIEKTPSFNKSKWIWSTILFGLNNPNRGYDVIQHKWNLVKQKQDNKWLILGDSSGNQGFNNALFNEKMNTSSINLCTTGDMLLVDDFWLLDEYLKNNPAPESIILIHSYDVLLSSSISDGGLHNIPINLKHSALALGDQKQISYAKFFPLAYQKSSLVQFVGRPKSLFQKSYSYDKHGQQIVNIGDPSKVNRDLEGHIKKLNGRTDFKISEKNKEALNALLKLTEQHQIQLYFAWAPTYQKAFENLKFEELFSNLQGQLEGLTYGKVKFINIPPMLFEANELEGSIDHIIYDASKKYTEALMKQITDGE